MNTSAPATVPAFDASSLQGVTSLEHLGVIRAKGEDAASLLHGQLTQDFALLGQNEARLAAFCSAKGRMQASFVGFKRSEDEVLLICARDLLAPTLKRLSMFVLRAKAKLTDATGDFALYGVVGAAVPATLQRAPMWAKHTDAAATLVRLPDAEGLPRALVCADAVAPAPAGAPLPLSLWQWLDVRSGVATVSAAVVEAFVPQMLNYESVGGVNFKKGCYPGQEVVARSQYRGTLKRRAYIVHGEVPMSAGQDVFHAGDADQPCGTVVEVAAHPVSGFDAVISMQISASDGQPLTLGAPDGAALHLLPLPYELLADV